MSDFIGRRLVRPVHRSGMTAEQAFNPRLRFDPEGTQVWDEDGKPLVFFDQEIIEDRVDPSLNGTVIRDNPPSLAPLEADKESR